VPYELDSRLVVGVASSALFDLAESDRVFREQGAQAYERFQEENGTVPLATGVAFPFIQRLLSFNDLAPESDPLVEVIVLSRNTASTGLRVMRSLEHSGLSIARAIFTEGRAPYRYVPALNISLFLSGNETDVRAAAAAGLPAGLVIATDFADDPSDPELRIAFDFDGVLADDESEKVFQDDDLPGFQAFERERAGTPHEPGPLMPFFQGISRIQLAETLRGQADSAYQPRLRIALITARSAPAHERAVHSLREWGMTVNDTFFLGGIDKGRIAEVLRPHIFFDDQRAHVDSTSRFAPSVHVPFGVRNAER
jgi:5'-nucleotidase